MSDDDVRTVQRCYPQIYFACHTRHDWARSSEDRLSARDASILAHLHPESPPTSAELARHLAIGRPTLSEALKRLERLGHVERAPDPRDARRWRVHLTERGAEAMQASSVLETDRLASVLARLTPADRRRAVDGLRLLACAAHAVMDDAKERRGRC